MANFHVCFQFRLGTEAADVAVLRGGWQIPPHTLLHTVHMKPPLAGVAGEIVVGVVGVWGSSTERAGNCEATHLTQRWVITPLTCRSHCTLAAYPTALTPPSIAGYMIHGGLKTEGVVAFITLLTHQHLALFTTGPAGEADFAGGALPAGPPDWGGGERGVEAGAMVVLPTARAQ